MSTRHLSDDEFEHQFESCTLEPTLFNHEAHLRLAWIHIDKYGTDEAVDHLCEQIKRFDRTFDDGTKYHATLTAAAVNVVAHFKGRTSDSNFESMITEHPRLLNAFGGLVHAHFSEDLLNTASAKCEILEPDLMSF